MASEGISVLAVLGVVISFMALVVAVLGLVPKWVPFLEARPHIAERMRGPLRILSQFWRVMLGTVVLASIGLLIWFWPELTLAGLIGMLGFVLWWFRREVRGGIRWLGGLAKRLYLWLLGQLVIRPATDHLGLVWYGGLDTDRIESLRSLGSDTQQVLWVVLGLEGSQSGEQVRLWNRDMEPLLRNGTYMGHVTRAQAALTELTDAGFVEHVSVLSSNHWEGFSLQVAEGLQGRRGEGARRWLILHGVAAAVGDLAGGRPPTEE